MKHGSGLACLRNCLCELLFWCICQSYRETNTDWAWTGTADDLGIGDNLVSKHSPGFFSSLGQTRDRIRTSVIRDFLGKRWKQISLVSGQLLQGPLCLIWACMDLGEYSRLALWLDGCFLSPYHHLWKMLFRKCFGFTPLLWAAQENKGQGAEDCRGWPHLHHLEILL